MRGTGSRNKIYCSGVPRMLRACPFGIGMFEARRSTGQGKGSMVGYRMFGYTTE